ncbi:glycosyltransferase family 2 protein [Butyrivibrio sp. JL13D10]|uniref:glycosyltransferase family 2 protein n=1 Tax=Butyrivibrio sp. JL13D10 TaxID=3236815 RepID=UPI0038B6A626
MLKEVAKNILINNRKRGYQNKVKECKNAYNIWEHRQEKHPIFVSGGAASEVTGRLQLFTEVVSYTKVWRDADPAATAEKILIFVSPKGRLAGHAVENIRRYFEAHPEINVVYGDEDEMIGRGKYGKPYFKPDWSPDTYLNAFYIGSVFACRANTYEAATAEYDNALKMLGGTTGVKKNSPEAVGREASMLSADVLFCMLAIEERAFAKRADMEFPIGHIGEILFHRDPDTDVFYGRGFHNSRHMLMKPATVSIIIPTKDHPDILFQCLKSIVNTTHEKNIKYEIVVVDNGSSAYNRVRYGSYINQIDKSGGLTNISYLYKVEDFNFSHMCNRGATRSGGEYLLFLNDDIEATQDGWLREMLSQAQLRHVGVVGAKLLYPDTDLIQHAGITNVRLGPVHKLQKMHDQKSHYFGFNRGIHNLIGATGACLMLSREKFNEVGGFPEELPVAFNDVDLCYSVYQKGYYNVCCNHISLYHHESLSRGLDTLDLKKMERLASEYEVLMKRHPGFYNKDPFYSKYLTDDETISAIIPCEDFTPVLDIPFHSIKVHEDGFLDAREDACLRIGVEYAGTMENWMYGVRDGEVLEGYFIKGYSFVIGSDNAFFERRLVLRQVERSDDGARPASSVVYSMPVYTWYRPDIKLRLQDQIDVDLTGYKVRIAPGKLAPGYYQVGMAALDQTGSLKLINWVANLLKVK